MHPQVAEVRARWLGHELLAEVNIAVEPKLTVEAAHQIATQVHQELVAHLKFLSRAIVHVDPLSASGEGHHFKSVQAHETGDEGELHDDHKH